MSPRRKPERREGAASLGGQGGLAPRTVIIKAVGHRRNWREKEYTQFALQSLYPAGRPMGVPRKVLLKKVNAWLANNPDYSAAGFGPISKT